MHAAWTLLLARAPDSQTATAAALGIAVLVFAPFAAIGWDVEAQALPYLALSAVFELGFFAALGLALRSGHVSLVYPLSRGVAPVLVLAVSVAALGADVGLLQAAGVAVIATGVLLVRGLGGGASTLDTALALACGACIAGYTLTDSYGLRHAAPVPYLECVLVLTLLVYLPVMARHQGRRRDRRRRTAADRGRGALHLRGLRTRAGGAAARPGRAGGGAARDERRLRHRLRRARARGAGGARRLAGAAVVVAGITMLALA